MPAIQTAPPPNPETIWAILQEVAQIQKETDRIVKETAQSQKETDRQMKETDRKLKEIGKNFGNFTNSFGDIVEYMIAPNLQEKFNEFGYDFQEASTNVKVHNKKNDLKFYIDVYLQNDDIAMLVEIKDDLAISDINDHIERLEKMRKYADLRKDSRHFIGAVGGIAVKLKVKEYALQNGFFLIEPNGEDFFITSPHNKPKEW